MDARLQGELNSAILALQKMERSTRAAIRGDMAEAAKLLESAVKGRTPVGGMAHRRYARRKGRKAAKGSGKVLASYKPGNLRRSFRVLRFRRSSAAFVGAKLGGGGADGYYAHMVERGTKYQAGQWFVRSAVSAAGSQTLKFAAQLIQKRIAAYGKQTGFQT